MADHRRKAQGGLRRGRPASGTRQTERPPYRRRRAIALLVLCGIATAVVLAILHFSKDEKSTATAVRAPSNGPKLAVRIKDLKRELEKRQAIQAQSNRSSISEPSGPPATSSSFASFERGLPGRIGIAYTAPGRASRVDTMGDLQSGSAWSTIKVAVAARVIKDAHGSGSLTSDQRSLISSALRVSDNSAAMQLWNELVSRYGSASGAAHAVTQVLTAAGDTGTSVSSVGRASFSPYGQTDWSLAGQVHFMAALAGGCVPGSSYLLNEMSQVVADQRWGLGTVGSNVFKGGWGPGTDGKYLVRQMGTLPTKGGSSVVAMAALPNDGQFSTGQEMLDQLAGWARGTLKTPAASGC